MTPEFAAYIDAWQRIEAQAARDRDAMADVSALEADYEARG